MIRSLTVDKTPKPHKRDVFNVCGACSCFLFFREVGNRQATDLLIGGSHLAWLAFSGSRSPCGIPLFHEGYPSDGYGYRKAGNRCHLLGLLSFREAWTVYQRLYRNCQFLFQNTEDQERNEAGHEVRFNPVIPLHVYRPRIKVVLHDPEGFFCYNILVDRIIRPGDFITAFVDYRKLDESSHIMCSAALNLSFPLIYQFPDTIKLTFPHTAQIIAVFQRIRDKESLIIFNISFFIISFETDFLIKHLIVVSDSVRFGNLQTVEIIEDIAARQLPAFGIQTPVLTFFCHLPDRLRCYKKSFTEVIELSVGFGGKAGVRADHKVLELKVAEDFFLKREKSFLLIFISVCNGHCKGKTGIIHKPNGITKADREARKSDDLLRSDFPLR